MKETKTVSLILIGIIALFALTGMILLFTKARITGEVSASYIYGEPGRYSSWQEKTTGAYQWLGRYDEFRQERIAKSEGISQGRGSLAEKRGVPNVITGKHHLPAQGTTIARELPKGPGKSIENPYGYESAPGFRQATAWDCAGESSPRRIGKESPKSYVSCPIKTIITR